MVPGQVFPGQVFPGQVFPGQVVQLGTAANAAQILQAVGPPPPPECLYTELTMGRRSLRRPCSRYSVVGVMAHFTTRGRAVVSGGKGTFFGMG
jgi:hypothetical protein